MSLKKDICVSLATGNVLCFPRLYPERYTLKGPLKGCNKSPEMPEALGQLHYNFIMNEPPVDAVQRLQSQYLRKSNSFRAWVCGPRLDPHRTPHHRDPHADAEAPSKRACNNPCWFRGPAPTSCAQLCTPGPKTQKPQKPQRQPPT